MVEHIVMWRMKDENKAENTAEMISKLRSLKDKVWVIRALRAGTDFNGGDNAYDVGLSVTLNSRADLEIYQKHPEHQRVGEFVRSVTTERAVVDFEYQG
jgi:hypothetical protein